MTQPTNKQLSRRDALKLLGAAAGASVLANLPSKWSTPQSVAGVLPAHADTSCTRIFQAMFGGVEDSSTIQVFQLVTPTWESAPKFESPVFTLYPTDAGYAARWE
ncbi:MAG TPA: twin-arginine translocation signal domain-containing protein, partial [Anaerolineae bacterium]|nr:twin-arginine translocation signal domain-containing protein [Anaerolineae bacterium]